MQEIGIRQARVFLAVAECRSVTRAARALSRSQTSVTKSLHDLESQIGEKLFDRSSKGVSLTAFGECLLQRVGEAAQAFAAAGELVPPASLQRSSSTARFFRMDVSDRWLDAFLAVAEHQNIASAALHLGLTSAAVSSSLRKLEDTLNTSLFERSPTAMTPTPFGRELSKYVKLARSHLRSANDEIAGLRGVKRGRLVVGTLPLLRTIIVPRAITRLLEEHSYLDISTVEGPYDDLVAGLRCGDIDLVFGALRGNVADKDLLEEAMFDEGLAAIVRAGHPLVDRPRVEWHDLLRYQWILPRRGTPTRALFEQTILGRGLQLPLHVIETSSLVMLRGLLLESDRVTILSRHQIRFEEQAGLLATLPFELRGTERPIGMTRRRIGALSPAAELFVRQVRAAAAEFMACERVIERGMLTGS
ncbi:MAG: LysR family transcriptional regulator [Woeseia sp.]|nr:LysR family transcriptional regulator [Woeseiaceae bacterium]